MERSESPTLADVASLAEVSLATASRALGSSRDRVSGALVDRVVAAAEKLHYVPNAHAQALARSDSSTVGLIVHDVSDPYFAEIARGVLRSASERDLMVMICNSYRDPERERAYVSALRSQRVNSILLAGSGYTDAEAERRLTRELLMFTATGGRVALVGRHDVAVDAVLPDNAGGARLVAEHLLAAGHRVIGVAAGRSDLTTVVDRLSGFRDGLADVGTTLPDEHVVAASFDRGGGRKAAERLVDTVDGMTAIFALNDLMAAGAMAVLRERGLRVPEDVAVVGFDDTPLASDVVPALTTVHLPMVEMGRQAMQLTSDEPSETPRLVPSPASLVVRASSPDGLRVT